MQNAFDIAAKQIGLTETGQRAALQEYLANGGANLDPAVTAWCAAFVNATLSQSGMQGTGKLNARSYLDWGDPVDQPQRGDIAVFSRGDPNGWQGHVGFFDSFDDQGRIRVLGGNQGADGAVSIASYDQNALLGFRRAPGQQGQPAAQGQNALATAQTPQQPELKLTDTRLDPRAFMTQTNALAPAPLQRVTGNSLARYA
jgi:uncharacterized protein (TIGR02594 family)